MNHAPATPVEHYRIGRRYEALCGRTYGHIGYGDVTHLLHTIASQDGVNGSGWGDWCERCRRKAEADRDAVQRAHHELVAEHNPALAPNIAYLQRLLDATRPRTGDTVYHRQTGRLLGTLLTTRANTIRFQPADPDEAPMAAAWDEIRIEPAT